MVTGRKALGCFISVNQVMWQPPQWVPSDDVRRARLRREYCKALCNRKQLATGSTARIFPPCRILPSKPDAARSGSPPTVGASTRLRRSLCETMLAHPQLQGFRRVSLLTRDAVSLYERLGFRPTAGALTYMEHRDPGVKNTILRALSIGLLALAGQAAAQRITPQFASGGAPPAALVVPRRPSAPALLVPQPRVPSTHWEVSP